jgi:signal transduction histidine kinase
MAAATWHERLGRTWAGFAYLGSGWLVGLVCAPLLLTLLFVGATTIPLGGIGLVLLVAAFALAHFGARGERVRASLVLGEPIRAPVRRSAEGSPVARAGAYLRDRVTWREFGYLVLLGPVGVLAGSLAAALWGAALAGLAAPALSAAAPSGSMLGDLVAPEMAGAVLLGVVAAAVAALATAALADACARLARSLLGPDEASELAARVHRLEETRAAAVESSDARLRRIERDLHDGAQHRLTYIAMELDRARERLAADPGAADDMLAQAHAESIRALGELRDVVRGIHPSVLTDRGLDAAISGLAERSPIPVEVDVRLERRPPPAVETAAYYVVAEALTNVAKHADARSASVSIRRDGGGIVARVADDGGGGARCAPGSGIDGLAQRVEALDGTLALSSPAGGPTTLTAVIPCGW